MTHREQLIKDISNSDMTGTIKFELDNLDRAELVIINGKVKVENEHGTVFNLEDLSDAELDYIAHWELGLNKKYDYIILTEDNEWISYGKQATDKEIQEDLEQLQLEYENIVVFKADELIKESYERV